MVAACGSESEQAGTAPGFELKDRTIDTSTFELVEPEQGEGPTTIPGSKPTLPRPTTTDQATGESSFVGEEPPSRGGPRPPGSPVVAPTTTESTTTTSTTTTIPELYVPDTASIVSICGITRSIDSFFGQADASHVPLVGDRFVQNLARYESVAPADVKDEIRALRELTNTLLTTYREGGGSLSYPPLQRLMYAAVTKTPPFQLVDAQRSQLALAETNLCS